MIVQQVSRHMVKNAGLRRHLLFVREIPSYLMMGHTQQFASPVR